MTDRASPLESIASYYADKLAEFGDTAKGVDWRDESSQNLRFEQLLKVTDGAQPGSSLGDLGCGYGGLLDYLIERDGSFEYAGFDISEAMIHAATTRHAHLPGSRFVQAAQPDSQMDFVVASGIFNVRLEASDASWEAYIKGNLDVMDRASLAGFSFNCLTSYSDADKMQGYLYYADPCELFDWCKRKYSRNVALLHDYGLYEFTILVRK